MKEFFRNRTSRIGLALLVIGCGPLLTIELLAKLGWTSDPNPNPVGLGMLAFLTFWPGVLCLLIGAVRSRNSGR